MPTSTQKYVQTVQNQSKVVSIANHSTTAHYVTLIQGITTLPLLIHKLTQPHHCVSKPTKSLKDIF